ncbi:hypothetical protein OAA20_00625 [bacterium]|nr:hypothetical protein [bacterium]
MQRYNSSVIGKKSSVSNTSASGIFSANNVADEIREGNWPYLETALFPFPVNSVMPFSVSRALTNSANSAEHRYGPTHAQMQSWVQGTSNGGPGYSWATGYNYFYGQSTGFQVWKVPVNGTYELEAKGGSGGATDNPIFRGQGQIAKARFVLAQSDMIVVAVGQGVPDMLGDHCNGAGGGTFITILPNSSASYPAAIPLVVAAGAAGGTSDGGGANPSTSSSSRTIAASNTTGNVSYTGLCTDPVSATQTAAFAQQYGHSRQGTLQSLQTVLGGAFFGTHSNNSNFGSSMGAMWGNGLAGGQRSNNTAGNGGFGGGSGGSDEAGNASGGFTTGQSFDGPSCSAGGFINTGHSKYSSHTGFSLAPTTTTFQAADYMTSYQYQGYAKITRIS